MPLANRCSALLKLFLILGILNGCRSERVAFQFQPLQTVSKAKRLTTPTTGTVINRAKPEGPSVPAPLHQSIDSLAYGRHWRQQKPATAGQFEAVPLPGRIRQSGIVARFHLHLLRAAPAHALAKHLQKVARHKSAEHEISDGAIFIIIALIILGFSLLFVGIPLLIASEFSLTFWMALVWWLGLIVAFLFLLFIREIIDTIGDLFRSNKS